jgi:hypothetical protein
MALPLSVVEAYVSVGSATPARLAMKEEKKN